MAGAGGGGLLQRGPLKSVRCVCACMCVSSSTTASVNLCSPHTGVSANEVDAHAGSPRVWWMKRCGKYCVLHNPFFFFFYPRPELRLLPRLSNESLTTPTEPLSQEIYILPLKHALKDKKASQPEMGLGI